MSQDESKQMIERDVKRIVRHALNDFGWFSFMPPANAFGRSGIADILAVKRGIFLAVETKYGRNTLTPQQRMFLQAVNDAEGFGFVINEHRTSLFDEWLSVFDTMSASVLRVHPLTAKLTREPITKSPRQQNDPA